MKKLVFALILLSILILGFWQIALPEDLIRKEIEGFFYNHQFVLETQGLRKGVFYNLLIDRIVCYRGRQPILEANDVEVYLDFLSLIRLKPMIKLKGSLGRSTVSVDNRGSIIGYFSIFENHLNLEINNARLEGMRSLADAGINGKGIVSGSVSIFLKDLRADLRFNILEARLKDITDKGYIPLSLFPSIRGIIRLDKGTIYIHSLSLEGRGIYGRIQDSTVKIQDSFLIFSRGSTLELMVDSDFTMPNLVEVALLKYKKSPGYYIIPLSWNDGTERHKKVL